MSTLVGKYPEGDSYAQIFFSVFPYKFSHLLSRLITAENRQDQQQNFSRSMFRYINTELSYAEALHIMFIYCLRRKNLLELNTHIH